MTLKVPSKSFYKRHLNKFAQYSKSKRWVDWCADIAYLRGQRSVLLLKKYLPSDARVLDMGCGIGLTLGILGQEYPNAVGCDISEHAVKGTKAMLSHVRANNKVIKYDGQKLPFRANTFDAVVSFEVIEHADKPMTMLKEMQRVLKKNGILIITTANKWWPYEPHFKLLFLSYLPKSLADLYVRLSGKGDSYENIKLPSYIAFKRMVEKYFEIEDLTLTVIRDYENFGLNKERGIKVVIIGSLLKILDKTQNTPVDFLRRSINWVLVRVSLGWIFLGHPKKR